MNRRMIKTTAVTAIYKAMQRAKLMPNVELSGGASQPSARTQGSASPSRED